MSETTNDSLDPFDFRTLFCEAPERQLLLSADPSTFTILAASNTYLELVSKRADEIEGRALFELFPVGEDQASIEHLKLREALKRAIDEGVSQMVGPYRYDISDGSDTTPMERYWSTYLRPLKDEYGEVRYIWVRVEEATDLILRERYIYDLQNTLPEEERTRGRVLIVEPGDVLRERLRLSFAPYWIVDVAVTAKEGETLFRQHSPDVVLVAMNLPDQRSTEFVGKLKERQSTAVIARVEQSEARYFRRAFEAGADDVITGPTSVRECVARVQTQFAELILKRATCQRVQSQYHQLFMQAPVGIALMEGPKKIFTLSNPAYDEIVGHRPLLGLPLREAFPEEELQPFFDQMDNVFDTGEPFFAVEVPANVRPAHPNDEGLPPHLTFAYLAHRDVDDVIQGVAVFAFDVTEQVAARRAVERENEQKDVFLAMLGHELRNPLAPIVSANELLRTQGSAVDPELLEWATATIARQSEQLRHHINDLLDVARLQQGRITIERKPAGLRGILTDAIEETRAKILRNNQQLHLQLPEEHLLVDVDSPRITQLVSNLLDNASKYSQPGSAIWLDVHVEPANEPANAEEESTLVIAVRDEGQGINPEALPNIFDLFVQDEVTIDRSRGGLGLGLALVKQLVNLHGGEVTAHSDGPDTGSVFTVRLPVTASPSGEEAPAPADAPKPSNRVLIVDDIADVIDSLAMLLKTRGVTVYTASTGEEAVKLARTHAPTHILLDIGLPDISGYEVARRIRKLGLKTQPRIAALSGYGQPDDVAKSLESGIDVHLTKPAGPTEIFAFIAEHVPV